MPYCKRFLNVFLEYSFHGGILGQRGLGKRHIFCYTHCGEGRMKSQTSETLRLSLLYVYNRGVMNATDSTIKEGVQIYG